MAMLRKFGRAALTARPAQQLQCLTARRCLTNLSVGVPKEHKEGEARVAIVPDDVAKLVKLGATVTVESGAGVGSGISDNMYTNAGAEIGTAADALSKGLVVKVNPPTSEEIAAVGDRALLGNFASRQNPEIADQVAKQNGTLLSLDMLLRTLSRGQAFDVLSSQAGVAGYRSVIEAANAYKRPFAGQMTAAGRVNPAKVLVCGAGVAGLAAIQTAKSLGGVVSAFDVRAAAAEQVEAMGAKFLKVPFEEDGSAAGGYAKEMSAEWFEAAYDMLAKECSKTDIVITTALIPGRKAPVLINEAAVSNLPAGSVTVDLAAEAGGNVSGTVPGEVVNTANGVTCIGYTNMPSRISGTASQLYSGNVTKLIQSMNIESQFVVDTENDEAVRSVCVVNAGQKLEPYAPPPPPPPSAAEIAASEQEDHVLTPAEIESATKRNAMMWTAGMGSGVLLGCAVPSVGLLSTFALSVWVGSQCIRGVAHALHSPLMSLTNAISGTTILGGMLQLGGGILPQTLPQVLGFSAVGLSAVNLGGGFLVTQKMLDMFRRPTDPPEFLKYYLTPFGVIGGGFGLASLTGIGPDTLGGTVALASGLGCVGGIACLADQKTARMGVYLGLGGVGLGVLSALERMSVDLPVYGQFIGATLAGGLVGQQIANRVGPTELPQAVAGFHCLVGLAATSTAVGDFMIHDLDHMTGFHASSIYMGAWLGSITFTGSVVACGKLSELLDSKPLMLPGRDMLNLGMAGGSVAGLVGFATTKDPSTAAACLAAGTGLSGLLGFHMTAAIGGADMPVVVTLLNSYSGWALCAEGFILDMPVLTIVGALIGSSGAFLTKVMCDGMNRDLGSVILGGFGTEAGAVQTKEGLVHTEIDTPGAAESLRNAEVVMITPGYGLAVAQAQNAVKETAMWLREEGKEVLFGVHPVAGRMPGQLNVLLAEAGVPYDMVFEMEEINERMSEVDVSMIVGANDTVNKAAEDEPKCEIAGMPVIQVWKGKHTLFMKRSMASGYAGLDNPTFYLDNTDMYLGDAKKTLEELNIELKSSE